MWTATNRKRYDRSQLRYPSDLTDPVLCSTLHRGCVGGCLQSNEA